MKIINITYLGQAGFVFKSENITVMIDPYLSDSVGKMNPSCCRRVSPDESFFTVKPDIMLFTHAHRDHYDPETVGRFLGAKSAVTVLAPRSVWEDVRKIGGNNNFVFFDKGTEWSQGNLKFTAVSACHSDPFAIGVIIDDGERKYYITGDTLYNENIFRELPDDLYAVFLPVNGVGCNMNMTDGARFAKRTGAKKVIPIHIGLFDSLSAEDFNCENKIIPEIYKEILL